MGPVVIAEVAVILNEWISHRDQVTCMAKIEKPLGFVTGSIDRHVKVWSILGELWGDLEVVGEDPLRLWQFPYNWQESFEKDRQEVISVMKAIDEVDGSLEFKFVAEEPARVRKMEQDNDILPKRSLVNPEVAAKTRKEVVEEEQEMVNNPENELKMRRKKLKEDLPGSALGQDVLALIDQYNKAPPEKRSELAATVLTLKTRLHKGSQATLKRMLSDRTKTQSSHKKNELLPMIYVKSKDFTKKFPTSTSSAKKPNPRVKSLSSSIQITPSLSHCSNRFATGAASPANSSQYLTLIGVCNNSPANVPLTAKKQGDIRFSPGETERTIRKATLMVHMRKCSDIANYNSAGNAALQRQMKILGDRGSYKRAEKCLQLNGFE